MKTRVLCLGFAAALALAQSNPDGDPRPETHGVITEAGAHFGIAGLQVARTLDGLTDHMQ
jgi:hypothetical protein